MKNLQNSFHALYFFYSFLKLLSCIHFYHVIHKYMCLHLIRRWKYQEFDHGLSQLSPIYSLIFFFFWRIILLTSGHNSHFLKYLRFQPNWFLKLDTPKTRYRLQLVMLTTFQSMDHCTPISKSIQLNYIYVVIEINNEIRCKDRL